MNHLKFTNSPVIITNSGYLYVFVSNESNLPVYIDNAGDKQTFAAIRQWQVNQATVKLTADQRSLVEGYVDAINSTEVHTAEVVQRGERLRDPNSTSGGDKTRADVDLSSVGGFNIRTAGGSHSVRRVEFPLIYNNQIAIF